MPRYNTIKDFWKLVDKSAGEDACWPWLASKTPRNYGKWFYKGKNMRAHRMAFFITTGKYPEAVCHKCDNPCCCNPKHLFAGTNGLNNTDRNKKGRSNNLKGEAHPAARLKTEDIVNMRNMRKQDVSIKTIAKIFSIHYCYASQIVRGERWKHVK